MPIALIGGAISGIGSIIGGGLSADAATSAGNTQAAAANKSLDLQKAAYLDIANKLAPFLQRGTNSNAALASLFGITSDGTPASGAFNQPIGANLGPYPTPPSVPGLAPGIAPAPSPDDPSLAGRFQASPGYQYNLGQQQNAIQNSAAGRTGAVSGNMLKALQTNASGLANQDYYNWYNNLVGAWGNTLKGNQTGYANTIQDYSNRVGQYGEQAGAYGQAYQDEANQRNQIISVLQALSGSGQNAAAQTGGFASTLAQAGAQNINLAGSAQAAGQVGSANAFSNLFNSPSFQGLFTGGTGGTSGTGGGFGGAINSGLSFLFPTDNTAGTAGLY